MESNLEYGFPEHDQRDNNALKAAFFAFAGFGSRVPQVDIDNARFVKLLRDAKLTGRGFTTIEADLLFAKVKAKGSRRLTFDEFLVALEYVAERRGLTEEQVEAMIIAATPGMNNATVASAVRLHDDKSSYTGVYAKGSPTNLEKAKLGGLGYLLDRSPADVRGVKLLA